VPSPAQRPAVGDEDVIRTAFIYQPAALGTVGESVGLEYSRHNHNVVDLYAADPYRASDHNPEIVGLAPAGAEPAGPQKPGKGNFGEHPGRGEPGPSAWEKGSDRAHNVLERIFG
jgi:5'-nucleotidase